MRVFIVVRKELISNFLLVRKCVAAVVSQQQKKYSNVKFEISLKGFDSSSSIVHRSQEALPVAAATTMVGSACKGSTISRVWSHLEGGSCELHLHMIFQDKQGTKLNKS